MNTVTSIFLDYIKALDCLYNKMLIAKIKEIVIEGISDQWFKNYVENLAAGGRGCCGEYMATHKFNKM